MLRQEGVFRGWKVDLHRPFVRSRFGFDYLDHALDIRIFPDRSWQIEDEDEFEEIQRLGIIDEAEAEGVWSELRVAIEQIESWAAPFSEAWERWHPIWMLPALPSGWAIP